ncbi:MAG: AtpZ/AtpI family protein [Flavobacteriales bacterium]|nr:AtpZ/AtpI family protein [Flavobacteriales bacterium]
MGFTIFCSASLGKYIDSTYNYGKTFTTYLTLFGVALSFYVLIKQLKKIN